MSSNDPKAAGPSVKKPVSSKKLDDTQVPAGAHGLAETSITEGAQAKTPVKGTPAKTGGAKPAAAAQKKTVTQLGDFKLMKKLGQGGMGTVYLAKQVSLDRLVALKTLSPEFAKKPNFVQRFIRESRSMAKLQHQNVVQVYAADSFKGIHFAAIEFIDGCSMQDWMNKLKQLSIADALHITLICADALHHAHEMQMIHRDIKPDNILVTKKGVVKVADFGLAKIIDDEDVSMTQSGTGLGTPLYMAPEQAQNAKHVDRRTDIYALGCTLYYFVTGKLPFMGESTVELILAKQKGTFTSAKRINSKVPERLDLIIDKTLAKDPAHRYETCAELIKDLQALQLSSPTLSFVEGAQAALVSSGIAAISSAPKTKVPQRAAVPVSSADDAARTQEAAAAATVSTDWYVRHKTPDGKLTVSRLTTPQIQAGLKGGTLDLTAKAKRNANEAFVALAQFPEFAQVAERRAVKDKAEARSRDVQKTYAKLDRQDRWRKKLRWLRNLTHNVKGLISLIVYLAILGGIGFAGWKYGWPLLQPYIEKFTSK